YASGTRPDTLVYQLSSTALDLDVLLAGQEESTADPGAAAPAEDVALPLEMLNSLNIIGNHSIDALTVAGMTLTELNVLLTLDNGVLNVETQPAGFHEG